MFRTDYFISICKPGNSKYGSHGWLTFFNRLSTTMLRHHTHDFSRITASIDYHRPIDHSDGLFQVNLSGSRLSSSMLASMRRSARGNNIACCTPAFLPFICSSIRFCFPLPHKDTQAKYQVFLYIYHPSHPSLAQACSVPTSQVS